MSQSISACLKHEVYGKINPYFGSLNWNRPESHLKFSNEQKHILYLTLLCLHIRCLNKQNSQLSHFSTISAPKWDVYHSIAFKASNYNPITSLWSTRNTTVRIKKSLEKRLVKMTPTMKILVRAYQKSYLDQTYRAFTFLHAHFQKIGKSEENNLLKCLNRFQLAWSMKFTEKLTPTLDPSTEIDQRAISSSTTNKNTFCTWSYFFSI